MTHPLNTPSYCTLSYEWGEFVVAQVDLIYPLNTPSWHTLLIHPLNAPSYCTLLMHPLNAPSWHIILTHTLNTTPWHHLHLIANNTTHPRFNYPDTVLFCYCPVLLPGAHLATPFLKILWTEFTQLKKGQFQPLLGHKYSGRHLDGQISTEGWYGGIYFIHTIVHALYRATVEAHN